MKEQSKQIAVILALGAMISTFSSCAERGYTVDEAGFFSGLAHGFLFFFALIGKILGLSVGLYAEHNSGLGYWIGYLIGFSAFVKKR